MLGMPTFNSRSVYFFSPGNTAKSSTTVIYLHCLHYAPKCQKKSVLLSIVVTPLQVDLNGDQSPVTLFFYCLDKTFSLSILFP